jgi:hypothetical protein
MQLAVDQLTCCIKVTGVGGGLRHDVEHDLADAVKPPGAEEVGPPRRYCIKGATGVAGVKVAPRISASSQVRGPGPQPRSRR